VSPASEKHGYSGTPLARKLGLKDGQVARFIALPDSLDWLLEAAAFTSAESIDAPRRLGKTHADFIHAFFTESKALDRALKPMMAAIAPDGMIWVSWPKKASKRPTDITEDVIRSVALPIGLVDVKVCAVDETWSGLKLVIRKELRNPAGRR
jgi:hypothetical protein